MRHVTSWELPPPPAKLMVTVFCSRQSPKQTSQERAVYLKRVKRSCSWVVIGRFQFILFVSIFFSRFIGCHHTDWWQRIQTPCVTVKHNKMDSKLQMWKTDIKKGQKWHYKAPQLFIHNCQVTKLCAYRSMKITRSNKNLSCIFSARPVDWLKRNLESMNLSTTGRPVNQCWNNKQNNK